MLKALQAIMEQLGSLLVSLVSNHRVQLGSLLNNPPDNLLDDHLVNPLNSLLGSLQGTRVNPHCSHLVNRLNSLRGNLVSNQVVCPV